MLMSKQRMIRDSFWTDVYIEKLSPDEKLIFLYLLTNPLCNVAGIYEIRTKRIGFETGYDIEVIENILSRFERDGKILRQADWIVIINHLKNQSVNPSIIQGCQRIFNELPEEIKTRVTGWVQAGLLNLTILNLTLPYSTLPNSTEVSEKPLTKTITTKEEKTTYGQFNNVPLTDEQYQQLVADLTEPVVETLIEELSGYMESTGKKYKNHYATLQNWYRRRIQQYADKNRPKPKSNAIATI